MIAIKDMEMPKSCWNCNFCFNKDGYCCAISNELLADEVADIPSENRPTDCPLVEIVTCKDCKYNAYETKIKGDESIKIFCRKNKTYRCIDGFCSDGKRRD